MATLIITDCINCGACEPVCPNNAIRAGEDIYVIDPRRCTECVGFFETEQCAAACPAFSCLPDPDRQEDEATLLSRVRKLHPARIFASDAPSRFRKRRR
jgi:ferredoxin